MTGLFVPKWTKRALSSNRPIILQGGLRIMLEGMGLGSLEVGLSGLEIMVK